MQPLSRTAESPSDWLDASPVATLVVDANGIRFASRACAELTGYPAEDLVGRKMDQLAIAEDREELGEALGRWFQSQGPFRTAVTLETSQGLRVPVEVRGTPAQDHGDGEVIVTLVDSTVAEQHADSRSSLLGLVRRAGRTPTWTWNLQKDQICFEGVPRDLSPDGRVELPAEAVLAALHERSRERLELAIAEVRRGASSLFLTVAWTVDGGHRRWALIRGRTHYDWDRDCEYLTGTATDITDRRRTQQALEQDRRRSEGLLASAGNGVIYLDQHGSITGINHTAEQILGWQSRTAQGRSVVEVLALVDRENGQPVPLPDLRGEGANTVTGLYARPDGAEIEMRCYRHMAEGSNGARAHAYVLHDLSELAQVRRGMLYLATHDGLTGLVNRTEFERRLRGAIETAREENRVHTLCFLDLDRFKLVNDSSGHLAGDGMLKQLSSFMRCRLRETDLLGRIGGDEFAILFEDARVAKAKEILAGIFEELKAFRFTWDGRSFDVGMSAGLVEFEGGGVEVSEVLGAADSACYISKQKGGNRIEAKILNKSDSDERDGMIKIVRQLHDALAAGSFQLYYQPIQPIRGEGSYERMYELFVRMYDSSGIVVPAGQFIPTAERHGLIPQIDKWVVQSAFSYLANGHGGEAAEEAIFTINISGPSMGDASFLDFVQAELKNSKAPPRKICFELTETAAVSDLSGALRFITALKGEGCRFALDDFGSGLSSFAYLRNFPADYLKIEGSFVKNMANDPIQRVLVESINHIGHVMHMKTIAEMVEDPNTLTMLKSFDVDYAQGFRIKRPAPLSEFETNENGG